MDDVPASASAHDGDVAFTATRRPLGQVVVDRRAGLVPPRDRPASLFPVIREAPSISDAGSHRPRSGPSALRRVVRPVARPTARPGPTRSAGPAAGHDREQGPADRASTEDRQGEHDEPGPAGRHPGRSAVHGAMPSRGMMTAGSAWIGDLVMARRHGAGTRARGAGPADRRRGGGCRRRPRGGSRSRPHAGFGGRPACRGGRSDGGRGRLADRRWPDGAWLGSRAGCRWGGGGGRGRIDRLRRARRHHRRGGRRRHGRARTRAGTG
jgi:hypothetical protein